MNTVVVYVLPTVPGPHLENACRFISTYNLYPAGANHKLVIVLNGPPPDAETRSLLCAINQPFETHHHDNSGYDCGAFQAAAHFYPCDLMVFFGTTAYLRGPMWLRRMEDIFEANGRSNLYGSTANCGDMRCNVYPHIRTTGFWCAPVFLNMHPLRVRSPEQRYPFEHGPECLTEWMKKQGHRAFMVTWDNAYEWPNWDVPEGFHQGNQSGVIVGDRLCAPPYWAVP